MTNRNFSIGKALDFNGVQHVPLNIIDLHYEDQKEDFLSIDMKKETIGVGTRRHYFQSTPHHSIALSFF